LKHSARMQDVMTPPNAKKPAARNLSLQSKTDNAAGAIGSRLRDMYDDVLNEPLPDDFVDLLKKLDDGETGGHNEPV